MTAFQNVSEKILIFVSIIGGRNVHLHLRDSAADADRNDRGTQPGRPARLPVPGERRSAAHSREEMVHGAGGDHPARRRPPVRIDLH